MLNNVTRGGQLFIHKVVMLKQVIAKTIKWSLVISLTFTVLHVIFYNKQIRKIDIPAALSFIWIKIVYNLDSSLDSVSKPNAKQLNVTFFKSSNLVTTNVKIANNDRYIRRNFQQFVLFLNDESVIALTSFLFITIVISTFLYYFGSNIKKVSKTSSSILNPKDAANIMKQLKICSHFKVEELPLVLDSETKHILITGTTGSGKTNLMHKLIPQIRASNHFAVIVDQTGEMVDRYYDEKKDFIINPDDPRSFTWDMMSDVSDEGVLNSIATTLFCNKNSADDVWGLSSKALFCDAVRVILERDDNQKTIQDLRDFLINSSIKEMHLALNGKPSAKLIDPSNERTSLSVLMNTVANLDFLNLLVKLQENPKITISNRNNNWITKNSNKSGSILFLSTSPINRTIMRSLMTVLIDLSVVSLMNLGSCKSRRFWFIIDELASLKNLPTLTTALSELRKYGGCVISCTQTISQLNKIYGNYDAKTIISQFNTKFFFKNTDKEVADLLSNLFGEVEIEERTESLSYGAHEMRDGVNVGSITKNKKLVTLEMLSNLDPLECFVHLPESRVAKVKMKMGFAK